MMFLVLLLVRQLLFLMLRFRYLLCLLSHVKHHVTRVSALVEFVSELELNVQ